jgi:hypothetical protein
MKKTTLYLLCMLWLWGCEHDPQITSEDQKKPYASRSMENRNPLLEYFSGVTLIHSPQAHNEAARMLDFFPNRVSVIRIDAGPHAIPYTGAPDFRTRFGDSLLAQAFNNGTTISLPSGTINRAAFLHRSIIDNSAAMSYTNWIDVARLILRDTSSVNIAGIAILNKSSRVLSIDIELYYTETDGFSNRLNIALTESNIQAYTAGQGRDYIHNHLLRDFITGQWGELIDEADTRRGNSVRKHYSFHLPKHYGSDDRANPMVVNEENLNLVVFVSRGRQGVITSKTIPIHIE